MIAVLTLPVSLPGMNEYISAMNRSRYVGNSMKQEWTNYVCQLATYKRLPRFKTPVVIEFIWAEANSRRDPDNIAAAKKFILDGLVKARVLIDDSQRYIHGFIDVIKHDRDRKGYVVVTIREDQDA